MCYSRSRWTTAVTLICNIHPEFHQTSHSVLQDLQVLYGFFTSCLLQILPKSHKCEHICIFSWRVYSGLLIVYYEDIIFFNFWMTFSSLNSSVFFSKWEYTCHYFISDKVYLVLDFYAKNSKRIFEWRKKSIWFLL